MSEFGKLDLEEMQGEDERLSSDGVQNNFLDQFVPMPEVRPGQKGSTAVRLMPPLKGKKLFQYNRTHKMNDRSIHCPRPLVNGKWTRDVPCPICDYYSSLWKQIEKLEKAGQVAEAEALKDEARGIKPVERYYYNAIVRSLSTENGDTIKNAGPRILSVGKILHKKIIRAIVGDDKDPESKLGNVTDTTNGFDLIIRKEVTSGTDTWPKYDDTSFARGSSPAGTPEEVKKWEESLIDLTKLRNPKAFEDLEKELAIHRGLIQDDTVGFDTNDFDSRMKAKYQNEVVQTPSAKRTQSATTSEVRTQPVIENTDVPSSSKAAVEDVVIEDADFMAELEEMGG